MKRIPRYLYIVFLTLIVAVLALLLFRNKQGTIASHLETLPHRSFRIAYQDLRYTDHDGRPIVIGKRVRWVNIDDEWKEEAYAPDGQLKGTYLRTKEGIFAWRPLDDAVQYKGVYQASRQEFTTAEFLRSAKTFIREDTILGYKAYVIGVSGQETFRVPEFGLTPLKIVFNKHSVLEAVEAVFEEVPAGSFVKPSLPVSTSWLEGEAQHLEKSGSVEDAKDIRDVIKRWKESHIER